jgi:MarR family transcriptional regulator, multiple antibiotic resistance protein MarR
MFVMKNSLMKQLQEEWRAVVHGIGSQMKPVLLSHDLTKVDGIVMMRVEKDKALTKAELADRLNFEPASLTRSLNRLVKRGLLHRYTDPADKRYIRIELTPAGKELTQTLKQKMLSVWNQVLGECDPVEITQFIRILEKARNNLVQK